MKTVYKESVTYAKDHDELNKWRESHQANVRCKEAIEADIRDNYRDNRLKTDGSTVIKEFGVERVAWVVASTIRDKDWDGRVSRENKAWAATVYPDALMDEEPSLRAALYINSHSVLLDGYADSVRKTLEKSRNIDIER